MLVFAWVPALLTVAIDIGFILLSRRKLISSFRDEAARELTPVVAPWRPPAPPAGGGVPPPPGVPANR